MKIGLTIRKSVIGRFCSSSSERTEEHCEGLSVCLCVCVCVSVCVSGQTCEQRFLINPLADILKTWHTGAGPCEDEFLQISLTSVKGQGRYGL